MANSNRERRKGRRNKAIGIDKGMREKEKEGASMAQEGTGLQWCQSASFSSFSSFSFSSFSSFSSHSSSPSVVWVCLWMFQQFLYFLIIIVFHCFLQGFFHFLSFPPFLLFTVGGFSSACPFLLGLLFFLSTLSMPEGIFFWVGNIGISLLLPFDT